MPEQPQLLSLQQSGLLPLSATVSGMVKAPRGVFGCLALVMLFLRAQEGAGWPGPSGAAGSRGYGAAVSGSDPKGIKRILLGAVSVEIDGSFA